VSAPLIRERGLTLIGVAISNPPTTCRFSSRYRSTPRGDCWTAADESRRFGPTGSPAVLLGRAEMPPARGGPIRVQDERAGDARRSLEATCAPCSTTSP
jgi:hypothetical protein